MLKMAHHLSDWKYIIITIKSFDWNKLIKQNNKALSSMRQELDVNTLIISYNRIPFFLTNESMAHATYIRGYGTKNMMRTYIGK